MIRKLSDTWLRFKTCDAGVTLVEYGVAVALAIFIGGGAIGLLAGNVTDSINRASDEVGNVTP